MSGRKKSVISKASPHTIKKFELIEGIYKIVGTEVNAD